MPISLADILSLVLTALIGVAGMVSIFRHAERSINLPVLFLTCLFLYLGGGGCFSLLIGAPAELSNYMSLYAIAPGDITRGCFAIIFHGVALWFLSHVFRHPVVVSSAEIAHLVQSVIRKHYLELLLVGAAVVQAYALASGTFGFEGVLLDTTTGDLGMASPWALLANWLSTALALLVSLWRLADAKLLYNCLLDFCGTSGLLRL